MRSNVGVVLMGVVAVTKSVTSKRHVSKKILNKAIADSRKMQQTVYNDFQGLKNSITGARRKESGLAALMTSKRRKIAAIFTTS